MKEQKKDGERGYKTRSHNLPGISCATCCFVFVIFNYLGVISVLPKFFYIFCLSLLLSTYLSTFIFLYKSENHSQISRAIVAIRVMDINDNAPEFADEYQAVLCENGKPGQVRRENDSFIKSVIYHFLTFCPFYFTCSPPL